MNTTTHLHAHPLKLCQLLKLTDHDAIAEATAPHRLPVMDEDDAARQDADRKHKTTLLLLCTLDAILSGIDAPAHQRTLCRHLVAECRAALA